MATRARTLRELVLDRQHDRLLRLSFPHGSEPANAELVVNKLHASEGLSRDFEFTAGHTLAYQWDKLGRLAQLQNENGAHYRFAYDPVGRLLEEVGFDGKATTYRYDETTGVLAEVAEADLRTHLQFDPLGRLTERKVNDQVEAFGYDRNGRLIEARNQHAKLQWFHDEAGNLTREHHADLHKARTAVWQHRYDELNQRTGTTRPDGHVTEWLTYGSGHVHGLLLDGQDILAFERDDLHREVSRAQHNGLNQSQRYDPAGRLLAHRSLGVQ